MGSRLFSHHPRKVGRRVGIVVLAVSVGLPLAPVGASTTGYNFRISGPTATSSEVTPVLAYNYLDDEFLVVWSDKRNRATRGDDIYGQRVAADGSLLGFNFRISGGLATNDEIFPAVAYSPLTNGFLVVWEDYRDVSTRLTDIYGQRVSAAGSPVGNNFRISGTAATSGEHHPEVANGPSNQFLVVWQDSRNSNTRANDIYGQQVGADGSLIGFNQRISGAAAIDNDFHPAVAYSNPSAQYLVVWEDDRHSTTRGRDVYGQRVNTDGSLEGFNQRISGAAATNNEWDPAVASVINDFLVVWEDNRNYATRGWDIYGQRMSGTGALVGFNRRISGTAATSHEYHPAVARSSASNQFLVMWEDTRNNTTRGYDIYGQRVDATGAPDPVLHNFQVSGPAAISGEHFPKLAYGSDLNQFLVVWYESRNWSTSGSDVYGQWVVPSAVVPNVYGYYYEDALLELEDAGFTNVSYVQGFDVPYHEDVWGYGCGAPSYPPCDGEQRPLDTDIFVLVGCHRAIAPGTCDNP